MLGDESDKQCLLWNWYMKSRRVDFISHFSPSRVDEITLNSSFAAWDASASYSEVVGNHGKKLQFNKLSNERTSIINPTNGKPKTNTVVIRCNCEMIFLRRELESTTWRALWAQKVQGKHFRSFFFSIARESFEEGIVIVGNLSQTPIFHLFFDKLHRYEGRVWRQRWAA